MRNLLLVCFLSILISSCCSTKIDQPEVILKPCHPSDDLMRKYPNLDKILKHELTLSDVLHQLKDDDVNYNNLNSKDQALVDWILTHCQ